MAAYSPTFGCTPNSSPVGHANSCDLETAPASKFSDLSRSATLGCPIQQDLPKSSSLSQIYYHRSRTSSHSGCTPVQAVHAQHGAGLAVSRSPSTELQEHDPMAGPINWVSHLCWQHSHLKHLQQNSHVTVAERWNIKGG